MTARPRFHVTAPGNWLNDPNGPIQHHGTYHLFYQYNPDAPVWGRPHWGHVTSTDLVHWTHRAVALSPGTEGSDRDGCWSGCARMFDGKPALFYTGVVADGEGYVEAVCRADGSPDLLTWTKRPEALISGPPRSIGPGPHRDPYLFRSDDRWGLLLGSDRGTDPTPGGRVLLYESDDLEQWEYMGTFYTRASTVGPIPTCTLWECPQLLFIDGHAVLIVSVQEPKDQPHNLKYAVWFVGTVSGRRFQAQSMGRLDHGDVFYAPAATQDESDRPLLWGWLRDIEAAAAIGADHSGALSLPRTLSVVDGELLVSPVQELSGLRRRRQPVTAACTQTPLALEHPRWELEIDLAGVTGAVEVCLRNAGKVLATLTADPQRLILGITRAAPHRADWQVPLKAGDRVQVFVDATILEVFLASGQAFTTRLPAPPTDALLVRHGGASFVDVVLHHLKVTV